MTQADSVHSTPPTNTSVTRRSVLGTAAGAAAALAATGASPMAAAPGPDPIFAAIERHRRAYASMAAVFAEHTRAHDIADAKVGPSHIMVPSMVEPGTTVEASCWAVLADGSVLLKRLPGRASVASPALAPKEDQLNRVRSERRHP